MLLLKLSIASGNLFPLLLIKMIRDASNFTKCWTISEDYLVIGDIYFIQTNVLFRVSSQWVIARRISSSSLKEPKSLNNFIFEAIISKIFSIIRKWTFIYHFTDEVKKLKKFGHWLLPLYSLNPSFLFLIFIKRLEYKFFHLFVCSTSSEKDFYWMWSKVQL